VQFICTVDIKKDIDKILKLKKEIYMEFKFNLGSEVKDKITGFKGIIRGRSHYLTGCNTYGIQSQKLKESRPVDWVWIDEDLLILLKDKKININRKIDKGGALSKDQIAPLK
jgi:hypothetical protein